MSAQTRLAWAAPVVALLAIGVALCFTLKSQTPYGTVSGTVVLLDSGKPIADAHIYLNPGTSDGDDTVNSDSEIEGQVTDARSRHTTTTDAQGHFTLPQVAAGRYHLSADARYHKCPAVDVIVTEAHTTDKHLGLDRSEAGLTLGDHQAVWALKEKPHLPIRGYVDAAKGELDAVHVTVYKTRLSTMLTNKDSADEIQALNEPYQEHKTKLSDSLLQPAGIAADQRPKLVSKTDVNIESPDREGFFEQRLVVPTTGPGLYLVQIEHGKNVSAAWVLATNTALVIKRAGPQLLAFAVDMMAGTPVGGAEVRQYKNGAMIGHGTTDKNGLTELTLPVPPRKAKSDGDADDEGGDNSSKNSRMVTVAEIGADEAVVSHDEWGNGDGGNGYAVYAYTDRTIYRPGQSISYKAIVRQKKAASGASQTYSVPANTPVTVEVRDPDGDRLLHTVKTTNQWGTLDGSFDLASEAPTGSYSLITTVGGEKHTTDIMVASYRKPEYAVTVTPKKNHYVRGVPIEMTVSAKYYYGAPVAGASVKYTVYRDTDWDAVYNGDSDPEDRDPSETNSYYGEMLTEGTATLDANGEATVEIPPDPKRDKKHAGASDDSDDSDDESDSAAPLDKPELQIVTCNATVTDNAKREVEANGQAHVSAGDYILSVQPEGYLAQPGSPSSVVVSARDYDGKPVVNLPLTLDATYSRYDAKAQKTVTAQAGPKQTARTGTGGKAIISVTPPQAGDLNLQLTAYDTGGHVMHAHADLYACSDSGGDLQTNYGDLSLLTDKKSYGPGETARVLINTARTGQSVLLTVEGERVYRSFMVPITQHSTVVKVPVEAAWGPNVTLDACYVRNKKFADSNAALRVRLDLQTVNIAITADHDRYRPGDSATYQIRTTSAQTGKPVPCEVSLSVVDESIYALRADDPYALRDAFYPHRTNEVSTHYSFAVQYAGDTDKSEPTIEMRRKFLDTAYWQPRLTTGVDGKATATVSLPDNLTTWRATVQAVTMDTAVGRTTSKVLVTKPFFIRLDTPRFLTQSDDGRLLALLHNDTGSSQTVHVRLMAPGLLDSKTAAEQTLTVQQGTDGQAQWPISAQMIGIAQIRAEAWTEGRDVKSGKPYTDGIETTLPVRAWGREQFTGLAGTVENTGDADRGLPIEIDPYAVPSESKLSVRILPNVGATIGPALDYLVGYPYGCTEQTASRMLPDLLVSRVEKATGHSLLRGAKAEKQTAALPLMVRNSILRLRRFQHASGAWGWWEQDEDNPELTAYALYCLALAKQQGFDVPDDLISKGVKGAIAQLPKAAPSDRPFLLYALAMAGENTDPAKRLAAVNAGSTGKDGMQLKKLSPDALAYLVLTARRINGDYRPAWNELQRREISEGRLLHWENTKDRWSSSDLMVTSAALRAMMAVDPHDSRIPNVLRYLLLKRGDGYWYDTRDTANVLGAMADYVALHPEDAAPPTGTVTVAVDGRTVQQIDLGAAVNIGETEFVVPVSASLLPRGKHTLSVRGVGVGGTVFYSGGLRQIVTTKEGTLPEMPGPDVTIKREYLRLGTSQNKDGLWSLTSLNVADNRFKQDDHLHVRLTITAKRDVDYVLIEDAFPSNCEPTERGTAEEETAGTDNDSTWSEWYSNIDVRDDRIAFFATHLTAGTHTVEYNLRAQTPGICHSLPAQAQAMYAPEIRADSSDTRVEVTQ